MGGVGQVEGWQEGGVEGVGELSREGWVRSSLGSGWVGLG